MKRIKILADTTCELVDGTLATVTKGQTAEASDRAADILLALGKAEVIPEEEGAKKAQSPEPPKGGTPSTP